MQVSRQSSKQSSVSMTLLQRVHAQPLVPSKFGKVNSAWRGQFALGAVDGYEEGGREGIMVNATAGLTHETAVSKAKEIADRALAPAAGANDKAGRFSTEAVEALGQAGPLGLTLSAEVAAAGSGPPPLPALPPPPATP